MPALQCPYKLHDTSGQPFHPPEHPLRADIPPPPANMAPLPIDERGYPVPFFVDWINNKPEFRGFTRYALGECINRRACWTCGQPLGKENVFVIGPMCAINRISSEPPSHILCARYAATACPFLTKPHMVRREADMPKAPVPGMMIARNPGVTLLWFARDAKDYHILNEAEGPLWHFLREPRGVEWYCRGRQATRKEVLDAIQSGLPLILKEAERIGKLNEVDHWMKLAMRLVPRN